METTEQAKLSTSARLSSETLAAVTETRLRLSAMARRELTNDEVIWIMHKVFAGQPEMVIRKAVQP